MKSRKLQEIHQLLVKCKAKGTLGLLFIARTETERNYVLASAKILGMDVLTQKTKGGFRVIAA